MSARAEHWLAAFDPLITAVILLNLLLIVLPGVRFLIQSGVLS